MISSVGLYAYCIKAGKKLGGAFALDTSVLCVLVNHRLTFFFFLSPGVVYCFIEFDAFLGKVMPLMIHIDP